MTEPRIMTLPTLATAAGALTMPAPAPVPADLGRDLITVTTRPGTVFVDGHGSWLTDEGGKRACRPKLESAA